MKLNGIKQRWIMVGIGGGGGKVSADFILKSRYMRQVVSSVYFMNTAGVDIVTLREKRLKEAFDRKWAVDVTGGGLPPSNGAIPVRFIRYSFHGTGNNFVRSRRLLEMNVLGERMEEGVSITKTEGGSKRKILEGLAEKEPIQEKKVEPKTEEKPKTKGEQEFMHPGDITSLKADLIESQNVIIVHSLGGGTGGGSAPALARWIKENAIAEYREPTVISLCMLASKLDGPLRMANSLNNLMAVSKEVDVVICFSNDVLLENIGKIKSRETIEKIMNEKIVEAMDILLSPMVGECSVEFDPNNLKTYLRMSFYNDKKLDIQLNVVAPFVSIHEEKAESAPVALNYALGAPQVPIHNGSLISLVPMFLSSNPDISEEYLHHKNLKIYGRQVEVKHLQDRFKIELQSVTGVHDRDHGDGGKSIDVLALGLGKLDLDEYLHNLDHPHVKAKWNEFLMENGKMHEEKADEIRIWLQKYNQKVDTMVDKMREWHEEGGM